MGILENRRRRTKKKLRNQLFVLAYLLDHPCVVCGEDDPVALVFDHIDRKTKTSGVSELINHGKAMTLLKKEMDKCRVLCATCHAKHTAIQMGWNIVELLTQMRKKRAALDKLS